MKADSAGIRFPVRCRLPFFFLPFSAVRSPPIIRGERKEKVKRFSAMACVQPVHNKPPENHTFLSPQPEGDGGHHFKAVHAIAYPVVLPDITHGITLQQLHVLVDGMYSPADVTTEHAERI